MLYLDKRKWIYIALENPLKTMKKLKGVFKPLKCFFKISFENWDYYPVLWCSKPAFLQIMSQDVMWKDKYDSPRYEVPPYIWIHIHNMNLVWYWAPKKVNEYSDDYWEQALWYLYYYNTYSQGLLEKPDINSARDNWPWKNYDTKLTTWEDRYLL